MNKLYTQKRCAIAVMIVSLTLATIACSSVKESSPNQSYTIPAQHKAIHEKMLSEQSRLVPKTTEE